MKRAGGLAAMVTRRRGAGSPLLASGASRSDDADQASKSQGGEQGEMDGAGEGGGEEEEEEEEEVFQPTKELAGIVERLRMNVAGFKTELDVMQASAMEAGVWTRGEEEAAALNASLLGAIEARKTAVASVAPLTSKSAASSLSWLPLLPPPPMPRQRGVQLANEPPQLAPVLVLPSVPTACLLHFLDHIGHIGCVLVFYQTPGLRGLSLASIACMCLSLLFTCSIACLGLPPSLSLLASRISLKGPRQRAHVALRALLGAHLA
jgi:hypothetical protein